jgi:endoglucanase
MRTDWTLLETLLSTPTAPFREDQIQALVEDTLLEAGVPFFEDPYGNIVIGAKSKAEYLKALSKKSTEPARVFIAHMDHPGFHGLEWLSPTELKIEWHGGSPVLHVEGAKVWLSVDGAHGYADSGVLQDVVIAKHGKAIETATVRFNESSLYAHFAGKPKSIYGGFQFRAPCFEENGCYYTKAADDLVGCFAILSLMRELYKKSKTAGPIFAVLTRAEEVGFVGAIEHFELGWYNKAKREVIAVSLETSRTLPGADIGKGPVVRLGDRKTVFHPDYLQVLTELAQKHLPNTPAKGAAPAVTRHQRRIMDGGSCEATAATVYGLPAIGLSVPLGNYHNQGFQGGPDCAGTDGPAPEFVHKDDVVGLLKLVRALSTPKLPWSDPWAAYRKNFKKSLKTYRKYR